MRFCLTLPLALILACCANSLPTEEELAGEVIQLSQGPCLGTCPVFDFYIFPDGRYIFVGKEYVFRRGVWRGKSRPDTFVKMSGMIRAARFDEFEEEYWEYSPQKLICATDHPSTTLLITDGNYRKQVFVDWGCFDFPRRDELWALADRLESLPIIRRFTESGSAR